MKTFEEDKKLKSVLKSVKLESPGNDFSLNVMNRIFHEESLLEKAKREKVLGKGFWIILALFIALFAAMFIFSSAGGDTGELGKYIPGLNTNTVTQDYENFFQRIGSVPLSIAGILLASSFLVFIDRFLSSKIRTL
ncbi:hypothetical protein [Maribellus maritimus]|uniref:hypothetical protein n=1 Tax=Maribellus maritimus TaxID=2870838 RepID=UPI001EEA6169|nr:hypothetical protein [Maribellus maritimus]MCG6185750.1 hypothetical protein [Maribellus maritimus]